MSGRVAGILVGVDTGGTFTDLVALTPAGLVHHKLPSTPADPSAAVLDGLSSIAPDQGGPRSIAHGTTVATNALLTGRVARAVLITTEGFEDVLEIGRQDRPALYDLEVRRPNPLIGRPLRLGVAERIGPDGSERVPLEPGGPALTALLDRIAHLEEPPEAAAVCLLHAYANPVHEARVAEALHARFPDLAITCSSTLLPVFREYERTSTVVVNAVLEPVMGRYLDRLRTGTAGASLRITASSGGTLSALRAAREPVHTLLSGPAAGVAGALAVARRASMDHILTFDMGGTSTDVALCDGEIGQTAEGSVGGHPVGVPQVDLHTVGAGGGSLARIDRGGALVVGPESAGADPGPLAYGRHAPGPDGEGVTVTDANLLLGRLPAAGLLGGGMPLDEAAARLGLERLAGAAARLGGTDAADPLHIAEGVVEVAVTAMAGALRRISVERGKDPRGYTLVAFGGAGGMHAAALARAVGIRRVLVPREPGLLSAVGTLVSGLRVDRARTVLGSGADEAAGSVAWDALRDEVADVLREAGAKMSGVRFVRRADLRYRGQSFELTVDADTGSGEDLWEVLCARFAQAHRERYGFARPETPVELVSVRLEGHGQAAASLDDLLPPPAAPAGEPAPRPRRAMRWGGTLFDAPQIRRADLRPGERLRGPALIDEFSATTIVPPDADLEVGPWGDLLLQV